MSRYPDNPWHSGLILLSLGGALFTPCMAQIPSPAADVEAVLDGIQGQILAREALLRDFIKAYTTLDELGASRGNRPRHSEGVNLSEDWARYSAARLLTLPHPYDYSDFLRGRPTFDPPLSFENGTVSIRTLRELRDYHDALSNRVPGILAEIRRLEDERRRLEAERTLVSGTSEPRTQGAGSGAPGQANSDALVAQGFQFLEQEDYIQARDRFEAALQMDPTHARAFLGRGMVSFREWGDLFGRETDRLALIDFDRAYSLDPTLLEALYLRGKTRMALGLMRESIQDFRGACEGGFNTACRDLREMAVAKEEEGVRYLMAEDVQTANRLFTEAIDLDFRYPDSWFDRGLTWASTGNHARAIEDFERYILHMRNAEAYATARDIPNPGRDDAGLAEAEFRIGYAQMNLGNPALAASRFGQAVVLARVADPGNVPPYLHYEAMAFQQMGDERRAYQLYDEACRLGDGEACTKRDQIGGEG